jgi:monoterpene epsilon-lactone hydrolase
MLIYAGGDEVLRDDSVNFVEKAKDAGVEAVLKIGEGLFHCFPVCAPLFPEATHALEDICAFIKKRFKG